MEARRTLTLRKCAYIFDDLAGRNYYYTREAARRAEVKTFLYAFYENDARRAQAIPYTVDGCGNVQIIIAGMPHRLNALQIASLDDEPAAVINHRRVIDAAALTVDGFHVFCRNSLYSDKFRTLHFEFFTGADDLGYIRVSFNHACIKFVIDDRTGELYTSGEHGAHEWTTRRDLLRGLGIGSAAARREFDRVMDVITYKGDA